MCAEIIAGCTQLVGFGAHRILDNAGIRLWMAKLLAFYIYHRYKEVQSDDVNCDDDGISGRNCCFPLHKFGPTCGMLQNLGIEYSRYKRAVAMMSECVTVQCRLFLNHLL